MDRKTKSVLIGIGSSFAAVLVIVLMFFSLANLGGDSSKAGVSASNANQSNTQKTNQNGQTIVPFDDDDTASSESDDTSSEEISSEDAKTGTVQPFLRSDIDGITKGLGTFAKIISAVNPVSYEWTAENMGATSEVDVKLIASDGSYAVVGVPYESSDYTVDGETNGLGIDITDWELYDASRKKECRVKEIVWFSNDMKFNLPRGVKIGSAYDDITGAYFKLENPDQTYILYQGADVMTDEAKLKAYRADKAAYVGGKIYKTSTLLNSFYADDHSVYPFADSSNNVIRYGFNSIVDTNETLGQWYIEYATKNSRVVGIYFHMTGADD